MLCFLLPFSHSLRLPDSNGGVCLTCVKPEASFKESQVKNNMGVPCEHATEFMAKALKMKSRIRWLRRNYFFALGKPMDDIIYGREDFVNNSFPEGDAADHSAGAAGDAPAGKDDSKEEKNSGGENGEEEEEDPSRRDPDALNEKDEANSREIIMMGGQTGTVFAIRAFVMPPKSRLTPELDAAFDICPQFPASQTIEGGADYLLSLRAVSTSSVTIRAYWTRNPDLGKLREPVDQKDAEAFLQETVDAEAARAERIRKAEEERKAAEEARLAAIAAEKAAKARPAPAPAPAQAAPTPAPAGAEAGKAAADPAPASAPAPAAADDQKGDNSV